MFDREVIGDVVRLRMCHGKANALDLEFLREISRTFEELAACTWESSDWCARTAGRCTVSAHCTTDREILRAPRSCARGGLHGAELRR